MGTMTTAVTPPSAAAVASAFRAIPQSSRDARWHLLAAYMILHRLGDVRRAEQLEDAFVYHWDRTARYRYRRACERAIVEHKDKLDSIISSNAKPEGMLVMTSQYFSKYFDGKLAAFRDHYDRL